ncbi:MAG: peroxiredoxin [Flaviaesturariibacter sp.]|nr:peroxiredoxin [Flaviaesturariibacter sp.]
MAIQVGQQAPEFSLFDTEKNKISLADYKGRNVLLLFFPLAFTSVCTAELCSVRDNIKLYEDVDAQPLGISTDSLFTLAKFKEEQALNFPLLSDYNKEVSQAYGSLYETWGFDYRGITKRSAFLIDKEGIIRYAEVLENAGEQPDFNAIKASMAELSK